MGSALAACGFASRCFLDAQGGCVTGSRAHACDPPGSASSPSGVTKQHLPPAAHLVLDLALDGELPPMSHSMLEPAAAIDEPSHGSLGMHDFKVPAKCWRTLSRYGWSGMKLDASDMQSTFTLISSSQRGSRATCSGLVSRMRSRICCSVTPSWLPCVHMPWCCVRVERRTVLACSSSWKSFT